MGGGEEGRKGEVILPLRLRDIHVRVIASLREELDQEAASKSMLLSEYINRILRERGLSKRNQQRIRFLELELRKTTNESVRLKSELAEKERALVNLPEQIRAEFPETGKKLMEENSKLKEELGREKGRREEFGKLLMARNEQLKNLQTELQNARTQFAPFQQYQTEVQRTIAQYQAMIDDFGAKLAIVKDEIGAGRFELECKCGRVFIFDLPESRRVFGIPDSR
jgi:chromosome segregation ATPase